MTPGQPWSEIHLYCMPACDIVRAGAFDLQCLNLWRPTPKHPLTQVITAVDGLAMTKVDSKWDGGGELWVKLIERNENENRETRQRWRNSTIRYGFSTSPLSVPATFAKSPLAVPAISELMSHSNPFTRTLMRNNVTTNHANKYTSPLPIPVCSLVERLSSPVR